MEPQTQKLIKGHPVYEMGIFFIFRNLSRNENKYQSNPHYNYQDLKKVENLFH